MQDYRAYVMGADGHVQNRVDLQCDDDAEALRLAKQLVDGQDVELWQLDRKTGSEDRDAQACRANPSLLISDSA